MARALRTLGWAGALTELMPSALESGTVSITLGVCCKIQDFIARIEARGGKELVDG